MLAIDLLLKLQLSLTLKKKNLLQKMSSSNRLLRQTDKSSVIHTDCQARWGARVFPSFFPVTCNCLQLQQKWQMVCAGIQNICAARLLVARPQRPACLPAPASFELQIQIHCTYWNGM